MLRLQLDCLLPSAHLFTWTDLLCCVLLTSDVCSVLTPPLAAPVSATQARQAAQQQAAAQLRCAAAAPTAGPALAAPGLGLPQQQLVAAVAVVQQQLVAAVVQGQRRMRLHCLAG